MPIYLHPAPPPPEQFQSEYKGNYDDAVALSLATASWGWHAHTGLAVLKMFAAGVFEQYPKLKIILGHDGELLPLFLDRIERMHLRGNASFVKDVWSQNIWVTVSGMFSLRSFRMLLEVTSIDKIMYSVDYPFVESETGWSWMEQLANSSLLTQHELDLLAYKTAESLLKISEYD